MKRLYATSESQAQDFCDRAHAFRIKTDERYAASVAAGQTSRWGVPQQDTQPDPKDPTKSIPVGDWFVEVDEGCEGAFTKAELNAAP